MTIKFSRYHQPGTELARVLIDVTTSPEERRLIEMFHGSDFLTDYLVDGVKHTLRVGKPSSHWLTPKVAEEFLKTAAPQLAKEVEARMTELRTLKQNKNMFSEEEFSF